MKNELESQSPVRRQEMVVLKVELVERQAEKLGSKENGLIF